MKDEGGKGGTNEQGATVEAGTRRGALRRAAEAGGRWGWTTYRWMVFRSRRGGG